MSPEGIVKSAIRSLIAVKVMFWIVVAILVYTYSVEIGSFLTGALDRFDFMTGYSQ